MEELSILELASKGGWIMIVLAILSIIAVYIFVERFLAIRSAGSDRTHPLRLWHLPVY